MKRYKISPVRNFAVSVSHNDISNGVSTDTVEKNLCPSAGKLFESPTEKVPTCPVCRQAGVRQGGETKSHK